MSYLCLPEQSCKSAAKKLVELQYKYILSTLCLSNIFAIWFVGAVMEQLRYLGYIIKRRMLGVTAQSLVITCMAEFNSEIKIIMFMDMRMCNQVHRFSHLFDLRPPGSSDPARPLRRLPLQATESRCDAHCYI